MHDVEIIKRKPLTIQVCALKTLTDEEISTITSQLDISGTSVGWVVVDKDDDCLGGAPLRVQCDEDICRIHTVLEC